MLRFEYGTELSELVEMRIEKEMIKVHITAAEVD
jgi:hypothetical protein